jgi:hypothetical protein
MKSFEEIIIPTSISFLKPGVKVKDGIKEYVFLKPDFKVPKGGFFCFHPNGLTVLGRHANPKTQICCSFCDVPKNHYCWFVIYGETEGIFMPKAYAGQRMGFNSYSDFALDDNDINGLMLYANGVELLQTNGDEVELCLCTLNYPEKEI